jgi:dinuclear metal center YbgI/SA1388 family protein
MKVKEITSYLESLAPLSTQEHYDNSGLLVGDREREITKVLLSLDCTEEVVLEAERIGAELIIAHHPIVFSGLKSLTGKNYVERTVISAIRKDIAIYAIHTNLDHYLNGVNAEIAARLGLENLRILEPKKGTLAKLVCYVPETHLKQVQEAVFEAGAGQIGNYSECSFASSGVGTFKPGSGSEPFTGRQGVRSVEDETRLEVLMSLSDQSKVVHAMRAAHPYEEVAYEVYPILNENQTIGSGMVGELKQEISNEDFLSLLKSTFNCAVIRHTKPSAKFIKKVALCGGSGSFLLPRAIAAGADVYISGDFKYHEFFDAEGRIMIADIGHYESEQFTSERLKALIKEKFPKFAVHLTGINTNPINYF